MKIALIGYGKMGKAIEQIALERGHQIVLAIGTKNTAAFAPENLKEAEVAIEFSTPETAYLNVKKLLENKVPTVCGTTAWLQYLDEAKALCLQNDTAFIYASNFSLGVNLFFALNKYLAHLMQNHAQYNVSLQEIHHTAKKDAPSGTAVTLANDILQTLSTKTHWVNEESNDPNALAIESLRIDPAPGTHSVKYQSTIDDIEITHTAHTRDGFAYGAVIAAEYIYQKKGIFTMQQVLNLP